MQYKIRAIVVNSNFGTYYGLSVPKEAQKQFGDKTKFTVIIEEDRIIFKSGCENIEKK